MVFVRVGQHEAEQAFALLDDEARIGHQNVHARVRLVGKGEAAIDHQPVVVARRAVAVKSQIGAELTDAAEGNEYQAFVHFPQRWPRLRR